jgi:hypothetical protein
MCGFGGGRPSLGTVFAASTIAIKTLATIAPPTPIHNVKVAILDDWQA